MGSLLPSWIDKICSGSLFCLHLQRPFFTKDFFLLFVIFWKSVFPFFFVFVLACITHSTADRSALAEGSYRPRWVDEKGWWRREGSPAFSTCLFHSFSPASSLKCFALRLACCASRRMGNVKWRKQNKHTSKEWRFFFFFCTRWSATKQYNKLLLYGGHFLFSSSMCACPSHPPSFLSLSLHLSLDRHSPFVWAPRRLVHCSCSPPLCVCDFFFFSLSCILCLSFFFFSEVVMNEERTVWVERAAGVKERGERRIKPTRRLTRSNCVSAMTLKPTNPKHSSPRNNNKKGKKNNNFPSRVPSMYVRVYSCTVSRETPPVEVRCSSSVRLGVHWRLRTGRCYGVEAIFFFLFVWEGEGTLCIGIVGEAKRSQRKKNRKRTDPWFTIMMHSSFFFLVVCVRVNVWARLHFHL